MQEISVLQAVDLREVWPNEARNFTPWLAANLSLLGDKLNLALELVEIEANLDGAGRADIIAQQVGTEAKVVIENQLGASDDSHCLRLLGYAANADANILIWVARDFTNYHRSILSWLNESDNIAIYAVVVRAYQVGNSKAFDFDLVVEPPQSPSASSTPTTNVTMSTHYANFYRPVVERLRRSGLPPVSRGGWRGRWRSFQTGYPQVIYSAGLHEGKATAYLVVVRAEDRHIYQALTQYRAEIDMALNCEVKWHKGEQDSWFGLTTEADISDPTADLESVGQWFYDNLLRLRAVAQPHLDKIMADIDNSGADAKETE